jgi:hypothetical protein
MIFSSGNQHDRQNALLCAIFTQNEISLARRESGRKALIPLVIPNFRPVEPRRYFHISRSAMMPPGALTGRLSCGHSETGQTNRLK